MASQLSLLPRKLWKALTETTLIHRPTPSEQKPTLSPSTKPEHTPIKDDEQVEQTIRIIVDLYEQLENLKAERGLSPGEDVNKIFGKLVGLCTQGFGREFVETVMGDERIKVILPSLRKFCAEGEALLEMESVRIMLGAEDEGLDPQSVQKRLQAFPYYDNYIDLTRLELAALYAITSPSSCLIQKIAFIGSGPLPLSSLCLHDALNSKNSPIGVPFEPTAPFLGLDGTKVSGKEDSGQVTIMNIDRDHEAIEQSKKLCQALGVKGNGMEFFCTAIGAEDGEEEDEIDIKGDFMVDEGRKKKNEHWLQGYEVVFLAALVGENQEEKERVVEEVAGKMKEGSILAVRSAEGMRGLLYPVFDHTSEKMRAVLDVGVVIHPQNEVVNSVIVGKVKRKGTLI